MKKLLQISIEVNSGSVGRIAEQIGQIAINDGWKSYITFARNHLPSKSETIKIGSLFDVYFHVIQTRIFDNHCLGSTKPTKRLVREIENIKPDIILIHHIHGYFINMKVLFDFLSKVDIPIVWVFHDCWSFTGHCAHFENVGCYKWKTGCYECPQLKEYPSSLIFDRSKKNFIQKKELFTSVKNMTIVPVSNWLGNIVSESFLNKYPIRVIQNGIDINKYKPILNVEKMRHRYNLEGKFVILGVASTWNKMKGLNDFIELSKHISNDMIIILVGVNKKQLMDLPIEIIGILRTESVNDLVELYSIADVFVNPTYEDTFPTTNLEALACGTPVITYRTGGSVESVDDEVGCIVEKGDIHGLLKRINQVKLVSKEKYTKYCRHKAEKLYNIEERFKEYFNLFDDLIYGN